MATADDHLVQQNAARAAAGAFAGAVARRGLPVLAALLLFSLMLPISFKIGSFNLTFSRIILTVMLPILLVRLVTGGFGRILAMDVFVILFIFWRTLAAFVTSAPVAFEYSASNAAIFLGAYMIARASIRTLDDFRFVARMLAIFVIASLPFALYEARTSHMVIPRLLDGIPGIRTAADVHYRPRNGIHRVQFVFTHPIHYGLFCSTAFALLFVSLRQTMAAAKRLAGSAIVLLCCFLSVSSGPFLALLSQLILIVYDWTFRTNPRRWKILFICAAVLYVVLELLSTRPIMYVISSKLAFNSFTANVRMILLDYGLQQIPRTPVFGVGFMTPWDLPAWMSGSLDNFWLAMPLTFGIPAGLFMLLAFLTGMIGVGRRPFAPGGALADARFGWLLVMFSLMLTLATVYIWAEIASLVFFMLGCGAFMMTATDDPGSGGPVAATPQRGGGPLPSRFAATHDRRRGTPRGVPATAADLAAADLAAPGLAAPGLATASAARRRETSAMPRTAPVFARDHAAAGPAGEAPPPSPSQNTPSFTRARDA